MCFYSVVYTRYLLKVNENVLNYLLFYRNNCSFIKKIDNLYAISIFRLLCLNNALVKCKGRPCLWITSKSCSVWLRRFTPQQPHVFLYKILHVLKDFLSSYGIPYFEVSTMTEETKQLQAVYGTRDVADILGVQESTVRKYASLLEDFGYSYLKNEYGHRAFFDRDLIVLRKMLSLKKDADMTLEDAAKSVVAWNKGNDISVSDTEEKSYDARYSDLVKEFKVFQQQQMEFNKELIQEIRCQREYIENRLEERDRLLLESMRLTLETRKELATADKKWWQFWK